MTQKKAYSSWLIILYSFILVCLFLYSEFFRQSLQRDVEKEKLTIPIESSVLSSLKSIVISNSFGQFHLNLNEQDSWYLTKPRKMPASTQIIKKLQSKLKELSLFSIHKKDSLSMRNFSLNEPPIKLDLTTKLDEKISVRLGLYNPINNTTYISISNKDLIYQVNMDNLFFQNLSISNIVDPYVFKIKLSQIKDIEIFRYNFAQSSNQFTLEDNKWKSKKYKSIDQEKVNKKIQSILTIKSHMIVDSMNESLEKLVNNYIKNTRYKVVITTKENEKIEYQISNLTREINELKLSSKSFFIMKSSKQKFPQIVDKEYLERFMVYYSEIK